MTEKVDVMRCWRDEENPEKLANQFERAVNIMTFDKKEFVVNMNVQPFVTQAIFTEFSLYWLRKMAWLHENKHTDPRNEYVAKKAFHIITVVPALTDFYAMYNYQGFIAGKEMGFERRFSVLLVEQLGNTHRTLQETISEIVFEWLIETPLDIEFYENISRELKILDEL